MKEKKLKIKPGKKHTFNIEINLSEKQLELLMKSNDELEDIGILLPHYLDLSDKHDLVTPDPSFCMGLGADINNILSLGFMVLAKEHNSPIDYKDLTLHPFNIKVPKIEQLELRYIDCEIESEYTPITTAIDTRTGELVTAEEAAAKLRKKKGD